LEKAVWKASSFPGSFFVAIFPIIRFQPFLLLQSGDTNCQQFYVFINFSWWRYLSKCVKTITVFYSL